ncbi:type II toxin-antitoxin system HicB family antitoxin [Candidatus Magnetobacterium casense]|uniref:type II toxin-antitoxin system HicB family antitoxin n=1 Tax=Candidatus Magnetobacterium casense TaxID=1455061 RepID=UPI0005915F2A|nr:type II toxin-antitoxin system HicB family antitoxin [Candidatus Magnetobacterium casensis]
MKIKVIVEKGEDGYFVAHCPSLKSCWSQGKTQQEVLTNIKEAIELFIEPDYDEVDRFTLKNSLRDAEINIEEFLSNI